MENRSYYRPLALKYRPLSFATVVGQETAVRILRGILAQKRDHVAYLFHGIQGVGKTSLARILAKCFNCLENGFSDEPCQKCSSCLEIDRSISVDVIEIDAASKTKVDDIRDLLDVAVYAPHRAPYKIFIIDEIHMLSGHSFNALLKRLEEPPEHIKFIFATTELKKVPETVRSRCLTLGLKSLSSTDLVSFLRQIIEAERVIEFDEEALQLIAKEGRGSVRDTLTLLEKAIAIGQGKVLASDVREFLGLLNEELVTRAISAFWSGKIEQVVAILKLIEPGSEISFLDSLIGRFTEIMALQFLPEELHNRERKIYQEDLSFSKKIRPTELQLLYEIALQGKRGLELAPHLGQGLLVLSIRMLYFVPNEKNSGKKEKVIKKETKNETVPKEREETRVPRSRSLNSVILRESEEWLDLLKRLEYNKIVHSLLIESNPIQISEDLIRVEIEPDDQFLIKDTNLCQRAEEAISDIRGRKISLQISVKRNQSAPESELPPVTSHENPPLASNENNSFSKKNSQLQKIIENEPILQRLVKELPVDLRKSKVETNSLD